MPDKEKCFYYLKRLLFLLIDLFLFNQTYKNILYSDPTTKRYTNKTSYCCLVYKML